jgi:hypothetical protein
MQGCVLLWYGYHIIPVQFIFITEAPGLNNAMYQLEQYLRLEGCVL